MKLRTQRERPWQQQTWRAALATAALVCFAASAPLPACDFLSVNVSSLDFGDYVSFEPAPLDSEAVIEVSCLGEKAPLTYRIDLGGGEGGQAQGRAARSGTFQLFYNLYLDPARAQVWGSGEAGASAMEGHLDPAHPEARHWIYGRIPGGQSVRPGTYSDHITLTILF